MTAKRIASECPIEHLLVLIGGRWKPVILWWLSESTKPLRFKALRENMPRISQKVLTQQLRELERDELVKRQMFPEMPVPLEENCGRCCGYSIPGHANTSLEGKVFSWNHETHSGVRNPRSQFSRSSLIHLSLMTFGQVELTKKSRCLK